MKITGYQALCNLGNDIDTIYQNAINGIDTCFYNIEGYFKDNFIRIGLIKTPLPEISDNNFNIRCNRLLLKNLELLKDDISLLLKKYSKNKIGVICATTNSGVEEYEKTRNLKHLELSNPAYFIKQTLNLKGYCATVSTACSSGIKAFILARDLLKNNVQDAIIVACVDSLAKVPLYGFNSLEVLSNKPCIPFSENREGMNISEACTIFIVEKNSKKGVEIMSISETSDIYHMTTPDPEAKEVIKAMNNALYEANIKPNDVDYINAHGTGTIANDIMEAYAINKIFPNTPTGSTKPLTGHCLGAAAGIEIALCAKLIEKFNGYLYPHIFDNCYDETLPKINLVQKNKKYEKCNICMCNSFGFSGTNAIMIMGKNNE